MITTLSASTFEIDAPDEAVEEILDQLDNSALKTNTIGILSCSLEYILNGTVKTLYEKLPFNVIGSTTVISDICGEADENQLSLMVLTSDDVFFSSGISTPLGEHADEDIVKLYKDVAEGLSINPTFGLFFAPFLLDVSADSQLRSLDNASNNIPLFGTVALDYITSSRDPRTIYNGNDYTDCMALVLMAGDIKPQFFVESISEERILKQKALITSSEGNVLKEVNNAPAIKHLESLGLAKDGAIEAIPLLPLTIDVGDGGRPAARAIFAVTPDGCVICGGDMPEQATLGVGSIDADDVQNTATKLASEIAQSDNKGVAIIFSCVARNRALGLDPMHEIAQVRATLGDAIPYLFMYSGGEIYPEIIGDKVLNKALNDSIIACVI